MPALEDAPRPLVLAAVVLYRQSPAESASLQALISALARSSHLAAALSVLIYDNSPESQLPPVSALPVAYHHDPSNRGLATAYNYALAQAQASRCPWLLLLDQDTEVTPGYLEEAVELARALLPQQTIAAIVPKLRSARGIKSPTLGFLEWLRRQVQFPRKRPLFATEAMYGPQQQEFSAFNSASLLRVSALEEIGGFASGFWLDFLDVAVFHALYASGKQLFVMHAVLHHELSMDTRTFYRQSSALKRHKNLLSAMVVFVRTRGTTRDCWLLRLWLLRNAFDLLRTAKDKRFGMASLKRVFSWSGA